MHYRFGSFQMDLDRFELCRDGEPVEIQPKSFDVLRYLLENAERIVSKQELLDQLWPGVVVGEAALTSAVREARRALGEKERDATILQTLRRRGYRIAVPVTVVTAERAPAPEPASARDGTALASAGETPGSEAAVPRPAAAPERDPLAYTPAHLADEVLRSRSALEGERKQVTVLFADVAGSMDLAGQVDPEEWHGILDRFFRILANGVHRFEGTINQYTGDGIMALFGAPIAHEDHAQRACYAALRLRDELNGYAEQLRREQGLELETRIGLNSGEVVVGKIGDDLRMDYTAQGQTVHLAKRMEQLAEPGKPTLAPATAALVEGYFELEDLGEFVVKGVAKPLRVHALAGVGAAHTRLEVARSRGLSRFVGRIHEMESLESALAHAREGHGRIVGVVGEAGVGKSRLCSEFIDRARAAGTAIYQAHCLSHGKTVSFLPMRELLRALLGVSEADPEPDQRRKIADGLVSLDGAFEEALPLVLDFLGIPDPEEPAPRMEAEARQRQLFHFVRRLVRARSAREAVVLFVDDVHWIDAGSDAFLAQIVEAVTDTRAVLLVNFRPEYHADWMRKSEYQQLPLGRLGAQESVALLDALVGEDASVAALRGLIRERTGGNPFFIEEVVRSLAESGSLEGARGAYLLVAPIETLEVPTTVQPVLAARIDRLGEREKQVLQAAAVIGREFSEPILSAVLDWPEADLSEALQVLKKGEFLHEESLYPVTEYAFRHPLTQEVALGSQLRERRARTHAAVARALEAAHPERLDEEAALLAHHYEEAGAALLAAQWHARAADWLIKTDFPESNAHWRRVYELAKTAPSTPESVELHFGACVRLVMGSFTGFFPDEDRDRFAAEGREIAERTGNKIGLFLLEIALATSRSLAGGARETPLVPVRRAIEIAKDLSPEAELVAHFCFGNTLWVYGSVTDALRETEKALELAGPQDLEFGVTLSGFSIKNFTLFQRASLLMWAGRPREAAVDFETSLEIALERNEYQAVCQICVWSGPWLEELTGTPQQALARAQQGVEWAERGGDGFACTSTILYLGMARLRAGRVAEALESLRYVDHMQREQGVASQGLNLGQGLLAEAHLAAGDAVNARAVAERCTVGRGSHVYDLNGYLSRARVLRALDGANAKGEIEASLERAQQLLEQSEAWAFNPFIVEEHARLLEVLGHAEAAAQCLREAQRAFTEVEATGHAERLARELGS